MILIQLVLFCALFTLMVKVGEVFQIGDIKIECILVPGHTWGHLV